MADAELPLRNFADGRQNALALIQMHVRYARMEAERDVRAAERPDVRVVHFLHAFDGEQGARDIPDAEFPRTALQQDMGGFPQDTDTGPKDQKTDRQAQDWVDPAGSGHADEDSADDDSDVGNSVTKVVNQDAAKIEVLAATDQGKGDATVDGQSSDGSPDHPAFDHGNGGP